MSKKQQKTKDENVEETTETQEETITPEVVEPETSKKEETETESTPEEEIAALNEKAEENYNLYLRSRADLENYRKRMVKEKEELGKFANERLILEILPALDNLFLAIDHAKPEQMESLVEGVKMTLEQILKGLEKFGVSSIDAMGEAFDPAKHEAMGQLESKEKPDTIVQEFQKGYLMHERLLRPSRVMVAKPVEKKEETEENDSADTDKTDAE